jgi:hypothetical protein
MATITGQLYRAKSLGHLLGTEMSRSTKIDDFEGRITPLRYEDDVLRLQVTVDDIVRVAVSDCRHDLPHYVAGHRLRKLFQALNLFKKFTASEVPKVW